MKKSLAIFLSFSVLSCAGKDLNHFPDRPAGWNCTYAYFPEKMESTGFYCNGMKYPESRKFFHFTDPEIQKARAMPKPSADAYEKYLREKIAERCN